MPLPFPVSFHCLTLKSSTFANILCVWFFAVFTFIVYKKKETVAIVTQHIKRPHRFYGDFHFTKKRRDIWMQEGCQHSMYGKRNSRSFSIKQYWTLHCKGKVFLKRTVPLKVVAFWVVLPRLGRHLWFHFGWQIAGPPAWEVIEWSTNERILGRTSSYTVL